MSFSSAAGHDPEWQASNVMPLAAFQSIDRLGEESS
jgi:hypothetical protein